MAAELIIGYAARFDIETAGAHPDFVERISPGAFARTIRGGDIVEALWEHRPERFLADTLVKTLALEESGIGLRVRIKTERLSVRELQDIQAGKVGMSFSFKPRPGGETWDRAASGARRRTLTDVRLFEVSLTRQPAYSATRAYWSPPPTPASRREAMVQALIARGYRASSAAK